jgi:hypothetical protein
MMVFGLVVVLAACSGRAPAVSVSTEPPESPNAASPDPYGPFPYANDVQKQAFRVFLACAHDLGVDYRGPFADSSGKGVLFGAPTGESISHAEQHAVNSQCPQGMVGLFATPPLHGIDARLFERSLERFVACLREHGITNVQLPAVPRDDPYRALEDLSFDWSSPAFTDAVERCIDPLRDYVFST